MAVGERAQELAQRQRRVHLAEQLRHPAVAHRAQIIERVGPQDRASRITGTSPACDTTFGSSNDARTAPAKHARISPRRCPLEPADQSVKNFDPASSEGIIMSTTRPATHIRPWIKT
jgi:hypothetical protein